MPIIISYLVLCVICGVLSRRIFLGFWGGLLLAVLITPIVGILVIFALRWFKGQNDRSRLLKDPALYEAVSRYHRKKEAAAREEA